MKFPKHLGPLIESEMDIFLNANSEYLCTIYARWQDEKKHEDFNDYIAAIKKNIPEAIEVHKRPFGLTVVSNGCDVRISVTIARISWKVTSMPKTNTPTRKEILAAAGITNKADADKLDTWYSDSESGITIKTVMTLKAICEGLNMTTTTARRKLRKANITKPASGWEWNVGDKQINAVTKILSA